jgi:hypothetical protein
VGEERVQAVYPSREELAWAAGFWDGEGSCGCYGKNDGRKRQASDTYLRASIGQNNRESLDRFMAAVDLGKVYGPYLSKGNLLSQNVYWNYQLAGKSVGLLFERLWPWLSEPKQQQYLAARAKFDERPEPSKGGHVCASDCTCGRQKWKTQDLDPKIARRRERAREATRRYRAKLKEVQ